VTHYLVELIFQGLINGSIYALIAVGLTMIFGLLRILHIAHAAIYTLGAYVGLGAFAASGNVTLSVVAAALVTGLCGVVVYRLFYKRLLDRPAEVVLIASIGLFIAMQEAYRIAFGASGRSYAAPPLRETFAFAGLSASAAELLVLALTILLFLGLALFVTQTRFGVACRATVSDPAMASSFGVSVSQVRDFTFLMGSAFAGIAGALSGVLNNIVEPTMGAAPSYKALAIIVLGGFGDVRGTLIAALLIGVAEAFGTVYLTNIMDRDSIAFALLLAILLIRPQGLFAN
jgi:branched-chain amino acid transport system permease protein